MTYGRSGDLGRARGLRPFSASSRTPSSPDAAHQSGRPSAELIPPRVLSHRGAPARWPHHGGVSCPCAVNPTIGSDGLARRECDAQCLDRLPGPQPIGTHGPSSGRTRWSWLPWSPSKCSRIAPNAATITFGRHERQPSPRMGTTDLSLPRLSWAVRDRPGVLYSPRSPPQPCASPNQESEAST
jgi:hypothetical protein